MPGAAFLRAMLPSPGSSRSSLSMAEPTRPFETMASRSSDLSTCSMPTTVICNWPSRLPRSVSPSVPAADRDHLALLHARIGDVDAAAARLQFPEPHRPGLRREVGKPAQGRGDIGVDRRGRERMQLGRGGGGRAQHRVRSPDCLVAEPSAMRPCSSSRLALRTVVPAPSPAAAPSRLSNTSEPRCGARGVPRTLDCPSVQFAT